MDQRSTVRFALWILLMTVLVMSPRLPSASVPLCLKVTDSTNSTSGLDKLTRSEVARHSSHVVVEGQCASRLLVELFNTGKIRYLSVGIEGEVPTRWVIENDRDIDAALG